MLTPGLWASEMLGSDVVAISRHLERVGAVVLKKLSMSSGLWELELEPWWAFGHAEQAMLSLGVTGGAGSSSGAGQLTHVSEQHSAGALATGLRQPEGAGST
jgi:hypothetical protein